MKWMRQVLVLSLILNVALFLLFFFFVMHDPLKEESFLFASHPTRKYLREDDPIAIPFQNYEFAQLVPFLNNKELVGGKIEARKIALAFLLKNYFAAKKILPFVENEEGMLVLYDLTDAQFQKLYCYAKSESYPLECKGIFLKLKQRKEENLLLAFQQSEEFLMIKRLFAPSGVSDAICVELLLEGEYECIEDFFAEQKTNLDLSKKRLQQFLQEAHAKGSKIAGLLLTRCFETAKKEVQVASIIKTEPPPIQKREYRVQEGDSLWKIAKKNQTTVEKIEECNKLSGCIRPGQILILP